MSVSLPPAGSFRCAECKLVQFDSETGRCRRCGAKAPTSVAPSEPPRPPSSAPVRIALPLPAELPGLDELDEPVGQSARDLAADPRGGSTSHLELDFPAPARAPAPRVSTPLAASAPTRPPQAPARAKPVPEATDTAGIFFDRDTGMVRTWLVVTLAVVCLLVTLGARGARMVLAEVRASEGTSASP